MMRTRITVFYLFSLAFVATMPAVPALAADRSAGLARELIDRFYDALAPDSQALAGFLGDSFQIIGSDGPRLVRSEYLKFSKAITDYTVSDIVSRRDDDILTVTLTIAYHGQFKNGQRAVPGLRRLAVFRQSGDTWRLVAFAALGTGINDVTGQSGKALARFFEALASREPDMVRAVLSPDFQVQESDGKGFALEGYLSGNLPVWRSMPVVQDLVATSFSNTMVTRYVLKVEQIIGGKTVETLAPGMNVFQRINGEWRAAAHGTFAAIK